MGSIIKKKIKGINYYYYVESKRVDGKPKLVNQNFLGTAEKMLEKALLTEIPLQKRVLYSDASEFGAVAMIYDIAERIGFTDIVDTICPKRKQGASTGTYILIEAINRAVAPTSTVNLEQWYSGTCLPKITGLRPSLFSAQNFWNNTSSINFETIQKIEDSLLTKIINSYDIDTSHIIYDATNFFTYIDTMQDCESAKRGHSKEKRNDLRVVGLSLMVSPDCSIPLLHETYPGNRADATEFAIMMTALKNRYERITGKKTDVTVIFDRGNNSEDNISILENNELPFHYVGGLKRNQCEELFLIPNDSYVEITEGTLAGLSSYRSTITVFGREVTAVIVYNPALRDGQLQGININKVKTAAKLQSIQERLLMRAKGEITKGKKPTIETVKIAVEKALNTEFMSEIFSYEILEVNDNVLLTYAESKVAFDRLCTKELGKTVLFTDRNDFTDAQIIASYRSAWHVESSFRQMKDTSHLTVRPIFHRTDQRIATHIFTCIQAYRLCCLLKKELSIKGVNISINKMFDEMAKIQKITTFFGNVDKPEKVESYTKGSELAEQIEQEYGLKEKYG